jgi:hypothetical protein
MKISNLELEDPSVGKEKKHGRNMQSQTWEFNKLFVEETCSFALPNIPSFHMMVVLENKLIIQIPKRRRAQKQR